MSRFTELADWYEPVPGPGALFRTTAALPWEVGRVGSGLWVTVPPGYVFDVSIPRWAGLVFDRHDPRYLKAAALHDWTLEAGWNRVAAAGLFGSALKADGVGLLRRVVMVVAVILWRFD
ncbi:DUF1353 domain-containing protein [Jannaschia sp. LMIT008]|uniref:DUF1353 domain-containing protein n=1 Tax=Jannaschia maritima TaxID=3032585 RepID=UPI0028109F78|nr:DUF1353 domain-containing protein [Jannaschia sp. LMIT008]